MTTRPPADNAAPGTADDRTGIVQLAGLSKAQLIGLAGTVTAKTFALGKGTFVIGRTPECDCALEDEGVSRVHARITAVGDRYVIHDEQSANGTLVNDRPVLEGALRTGDEIRIGAARFSFVIDQVASRRTARARLVWLVVGTAGLTIAGLVAFLIAWSPAPDAMQIAGAGLVEQPALPAAPPPQPAPAPPPPPELPPPAPPQPAPRVDVATKVDGHVETVAVAVGQAVRSGDLLVELANRELARAIETSRQSLNALAPIALSSPDAEQALKSERARLRRFEQRQKPLRIVAPMSGKVVELRTSAGAKVRAGETVVVIAPD